MCRIAVASVVIVALVGTALADTATLDQGPPPPGAPTRTPCAYIFDTANCGNVFSHSTADGPVAMDSYSCVAWDETGPEFVYELTVAGGGPFDVSAAITNVVGGDLDVFILSACDSDTCLAYGDDTATVSDVAAGTVLYVVVDGKNSGYGSYDVTFTCTGPPPPPPPSDTCPLAPRVTTLPYYVEFDNVASTAGAPPGSCNYPPATTMQNDVWCSFETEAECSLYFDVQYSYDGITAVHRGPDCDHLTEEVCLESGSSYPDGDETQITTVAGTVYWIQIGKTGTSPGGGANISTLTDTAGGCVMVPAGARIFVDGFESGGSEAWSDTTP